MRTPRDRRISDQKRPRPSVAFSVRRAAGARGFELSRGRGDSEIVVDRFDRQVQRGGDLRNLLPLVVELIDLLHLRQPNRIGGTDVGLLILSLDLRGLPIRSSVPSRER